MSVKTARCIVVVTALLAAVGSHQVAGTEEAAGCLLAVRMGGLVGFYSVPLESATAPRRTGAESMEVAVTWALFPNAAPERQRSFLQKEVAHPRSFAYGGTNRYGAEDPMPSHTLFVRIPVANLVKFDPMAGIPKGTVLLDPTAEDPFKPSPTGAREPAEIVLESMESGTVTLVNFGTLPVIFEAGDDKPRSASLDQCHVRDPLGKDSALAGRIKFGAGWSLAPCGTGVSTHGCEGPFHVSYESATVFAAFLSRSGSTKKFVQPALARYASDVAAERAVTSTAVKLKIVRASGGTTEIPLMAANGRIDLYVGNAPGDEIVAAPVQHHDDSARFEHLKLMYMLGKARGKLDTPYYFWTRKDREPGDSEPRIAHHCAGLSVYERAE